MTTFKMSQLMAYLMLILSPSDYTKAAAPERAKEISLYSLVPYKGKLNFNNPDYITITLECDNNA